MMTEIIYVDCILCNEEMLGITHIDIRDVCDACGGNLTDYDSNNPHPYSCYGKTEKTFKEGE